MEVALRVCIFWNSGKIFNVSILVVMEVALRVRYREVRTTNLFVSILVVMEVALREAEFRFSHEFCVSILVVMEVALREYMRQMSLFSVCYRVLLT